MVRHLPERECRNEDEFLCDHPKIMLMPPMRTCFIQNVKNIIILVQFASPTVSQIEFVPNERHLSRQQLPTFRPSDLALRMHLLFRDPTD
jgi:hypothetical protein